MLDIDNASEYLKKLNIWTDGNIDPFKLNPVFFSLLSKSLFDDAQKMISNLRDCVFISQIKSRVDTMQSQLDGIRSILEKFDDKNFDYKKIYLKAFDLVQIELEDFTNICQLNRGLYKKKRIFYQISNFNKDFIENPDYELFKKLGFGREINSSVPEKIRIMNNARIFSFHKDFYCVSENEFFDKNISGRLSRLVSFNYLKSSNLVINKAIILPIDISSNNYYHNISETVYGLRFLKFFSDDYNILFTDDRFGAVDYLSEKLNINKKRLLKLKDYDGALVKRAIQLYPIGFSWNSDIYEFFSLFRIDKNIRKKYYISRADSSRSFINEKDLEDLLSSMGFDIVKPEKLSFGEQIEIFSQTDFLIAGHGAGLTNILFMPKRAKIIEIFPLNIIKPDFYFRSVHNEFRYKGLIAKDNKVDLGQIRQMILDFEN